MASEKQIAANKRNAQKSTGPKTAEGKNKASQNAVTHGLTSHRPVLDNEDTAEFRKYVNELIDQLDPTNPWEFVFAKRASCQAWRIQRALCYETLALDNLLKSASETKNKKPNNNTQARSVPVASKQSDDGSDGIDSILPMHPNASDVPQIENRTSSIYPQGIENHKSLLGQAIVDDFRNHWTLDKLARYESRIENSMMRCLDKFQKVRESQMMNFTSLRHYYRGFTRRPQDFQDDPNTQTPTAPVQNEATAAASASEPIFHTAPTDSLHNDIDKTNPNVAQSPSAVLPTSTDGFDKTNPISALSAQKPASQTEITKNEPNSGGTFKDVLSISEEHPCGCSGQIENRQSNIENPNASDVLQIENRTSTIENQTAALINDDFNSFSQWADLKGHAYGYDDESLEPHCPNPPSTGEYVYVENWHHKLLRMVNYPWDKRKNLTKPQLNDLVDTILCGMSDPVQFLWDFGLIELNAEAAAKRSLAAQTEEQVPALAC